MDNPRPPMSPQDEEHLLSSMFEEGIKELVLNDKYKGFLDAMAKFSNYSERNVMLIQKQMPDASMVATFRAWKGLGRNIVEGEKSRARIIAPIAPKAKWVKKQKEDINTGEPLIDEHGKVIYETVTAQGEPKFRPLAVFDVS